MHMGTCERIHGIVYTPGGPAEALCIAVRQLLVRIISRKPLALQKASRRQQAQAIASAAARTWAQLTAALAAWWQAAVGHRCSRRLEVLTWGEPCMQSVRIRDSTPGCTLPPPMVAALRNAVWSALAQRATALVCIVCYRSHMSAGAPALLQAAASLMQVASPAAPSAAGAPLATLGTLSTTWISWS